MFIRFINALNIYSPVVFIRQTGRKERGVTGEFFYFIHLFITNFLIVIEKTKQLCINP